MKPREWTLRSSHRNNGVWYASTNLNLHSGYKSVVHVIEKSAYDDLEARVKGLSEALEYLAGYRIDTSKLGYIEPEFRKFAQQALEQWGWKGDAE